MIELKLCPFCGGEAFHYSGNDNINLDSMSDCDKEMHFIMCKVSCVGLRANRRNSSLSLE